MKSSQLTFNKSQTSDFEVIKPTWTLVEDNIILVRAMVIDDIRYELESMDALSSKEKGWPYQLTRGLSLFRVDYMTN